MRKLLYPLASVLFSVAFQVSIAIWPDQLRTYSWLVKYVWIACGLVSLLVLVQWLVSKKHKGSVAGEQPSSSTSQISVNVSPTISPVIAPTISSGHSEFPNVMEEALKLKIKRQAEAIVTPKPNIGCLKPETIEIQRDEETDVWSREPGGAGLRAVVVPFTNESRGGGRRTPPAQNLRCRLTFYRGDDVAEFKRIDYGCWLDQPFRSTSLEVDGIAYLIVLIQMDQLACTIYNPRFSAERYLEDSTVIDLLPDGTYDLKVTVMAGEQGEYREDFGFKVKVGGGSFSVTRSNPTFAITAGAVEHGPGLEPNHRIVALARKLREKAREERAKHDVKTVASFPTAAVAAMLGEDWELAVPVLEYLRSEGQAEEDVWGRWIIK